MRDILYIAIHCTATPQTATIDSIKRYWKDNLKWKSPGYHFIIKPDGEAVSLLPITEVSNGVKGVNHCAINISYIGGIDKNNNPSDNRTPNQIATLLRLVKELKTKFPKAIVQGHRDFPNVKKACPSFDAKKTYMNV